MIQARTLLMLAMINLALGIPIATAHEWHVVQGDIVRVETALPGRHASLRCFGKSWPVRMSVKGHWTGWIGVDLGQKPGRYTLHWASKKRKVSDYLYVDQGHFRISRITVKRTMAVFDAKALGRIHADHAALRKAYAMKVNARPDISIIGRPLDGIVSTPFGARRYVNGEPRAPHTGLDIAAPEGTPIVNPLAGRILLVKPMFLNGNTVVVGSGLGLVMVYSHLKSLHVHQGAWLEAGQIIGEVGQTGRATGPHLHWGVRFNGARVNPDSLPIRVSRKRRNRRARATEN